MVTTSRVIPLLLYTEGWVIHYAVSRTEHSKENICVGYNSGVDHVTTDQQVQIPPVCGFGQEHLLNEHVEDQEDLELHPNTGNTILTHTSSDAHTAVCSCHTDSQTLMQHLTSERVRVRVFRPNIKHRMLTSGKVLII